MSIFVKFWLFTMPTHQIWSCHVTQDANFIFYFVLILHLILGKVTKFLVEKLSTSEVMSRKPQGRGGGGVGKHPSVPLGLSCFCLAEAF